MLIAVCVFLEVAQRQGRAKPLIEPERGYFCFSSCFEHRLIHRHIPSAITRGWIFEQGEQLILPHHIVRALAAMGAWEACLAAVDDVNLRAPALRALQMMHAKGGVDGLLAKLEKAGSDNAIRFDVMGALARLYHREGTWDLKHW